MVKNLSVDKRKNGSRKMKSVVATALVTAMALPSFAGIPMKAEAATVTLTGPDGNSYSVAVWGNGIIGVNRNGGYYIASKYIGGYPDVSIIDVKTAVFNGNNIDFTYTINNKADILRDTFVNVPALKDTIGLDAYTNLSKPATYSQTIGIVNFSGKVPYDYYVKHKDIGDWVKLVKGVNSSSYTVYEKGTLAVRAVSPTTGEILAEQSFYVGNISYTNRLKATTPDGLSFIDFSVSPSFSTYTVNGGVAKTFNLVNQGNYTIMFKNIVGYRWSGSALILEMLFSDNRIYEQTFYGFYTPPTIPIAPSIASNITTPTNGNVNISITYPENATKKEYRIGASGTWRDYSAPVVVSENSVIYARASNIAGTSPEVSYTVNNIDKTAPVAATLVADKTTPTNGDVKVTINYPADGATKQYKIGSGAWTAYTAPVVMTANGTVYARSIDAAGNTSVESNLAVSNIDKTPPTPAKLAADKTTPTNGNVTVTITYPADGVTKQYKIGASGTWTAYTTPIVVSANNTVFARSSDALGNTSAESNLVISNIDKVAPVAATFTADKTTPTNGDVKVTINYPADGETKQYKIGASGTWTTYTAPVVMTANGTVYARSTDAAGNTSAESNLVVSNIDKTAPVAATLSPSTTAPTNGNVTVTITYPADGATKQYKIGTSGTWTAYTAPVVMSANDTIYARSTDAAGNTSGESTLVVSNIDKTPPTPAKLAADKTTPTNGNVTVTITYPADGATKQYKIGSGAWTAYTVPVVMSANDTIYARSTDAAGNTSAESNLVVSNIDKTAPVAATLSPSTTAPTNGNVTVTITYPADGATKQYKIGSGAWTAYTAPVVMTANGTVYARSIDAAGNTSVEANLAVGNIDKTPPTPAKLAADKTTPTNGNVTVTITYPADGATKQYKIGSGAWTAYTVPVVMSANDTVYARSSDALGNMSEESSLVVNNIDKTAPVAATLVADKTTPTNGDVKVTITYPGDATTKQYRVGSGAWTAYTTPVVVSANGTVYARSIDAAGNTSVESNLVVSNIDKTPPASATLVADKTTPTNGDVKVTITYPADGATKEYKIGSGAWTPYTVPVVMSVNDTIYARSSDAVGNMSAESNLVVSNIDKTAPVAATLVPDKTMPTNGNVTVTITYPADGATKQYKIGSGAWTAYTVPVVMTANGTVYARSTDAAGNTSAESNVVVSNIDKTPPVSATLSPNTTAPTNGNVSVTITYPADAVTKQYKVGSSGTWTAYTEPVVMSANDTIYARSADAAGNISVESNLVVSNIDKTPPVSATLVADKTTPTNGNVTVTITYPADGATKQYKIGTSGTWTAYTAPVVMSANDTIYARSLDVAGNTSVESNLIVNNIDKIAPTSPTATINGSELTITPGTDASGIQSTQYQLNNGAWITYSGVVRLVDGLYTINVKSIDKVGNESLITTIKVTIFDEALDLAKKAVEAAEATPSQAKIDVAQDLVTKLPATSDKTDLQKRLDKVQADVDLYNAIQSEINSMNVVVDKGNVKKEVIVKYKERVDKLYVQVSTLPNTMDKAGLNKQLDDLKAKLILIENLLDVNTDGNFEDVDLGEMEDIINQLPDGELKDDLQDQLDKAKDLQDAIEKVEKAEDSRTQKDVDTARDAVSKLPDGEIKDDLNDRLDAIQKEIDHLNAIEEAVKKAEKTKKQVDVDAARDLVNTLPVEKEYLDYHQRLDVVDAALKAATTKVGQAETYLRDPYLTDAQTRIDALKDSPAKQVLQDRLDAITKSIGSEPDDGKDGEFNPGDNIGEVADSIKDPIAKKYYADWAKAVERAERYFSKGNIVFALDKMNAVPDEIRENPKYSALYEEMKTRSETLKRLYNQMVADKELEKEINTAINAIDLYERYQSALFKDKAQVAVDAVTNEEMKIMLQARIDAVIQK